MSAPLDLYRLTRIWQTADGSWWSTLPERFDGPNGRTEARIASDRWERAGIWVTDSARGNGAWLRRKIVVEHGRQWPNRSDATEWESVHEVEIDPPLLEPVPALAAGTA